MNPHSLFIKFHAIALAKSAHFDKNIYVATQTGAFAKDFGLRDQIQRAAVSIMSNVAEGFERNSPADFARFLSIAKASCAELRSQLYVAFDVNYLTETEFTALTQQAVEVSRVIGGLKVAVERRQ